MTTNTNASGVAAPESISVSRKTGSGERGKRSIANTVEPGDTVIVYGHHDVVDGARGVVLGTRPDGWVSLHLMVSDAQLIVRADQVRRTEARS